jgi:Phage tail assembly chaperone proteins, E, or 41 or 14
MENVVVVKLSRPVTHIDTTFTELHLREPNGDDLVAAGDPSNANEYTLQLAARLGNCGREVLGKMAGRDVLVIGRVIAGFLAEPAPPTSSTATSSAPGGGTTSAGSSA